MLQEMDEDSALSAVNSGAGFAAFLALKCIILLKDIGEHFLNICKFFINHNC